MSNSITLLMVSNDICVSFWVLFVLAAIPTSDCSLEAKGRRDGGATPRAALHDDISYKRRWHQKQRRSDSRQQQLCVRPLNVDDSLVSRPSKLCIPPPHPHKLNPNITWRLANFPQAVFNYSHDVLLSSSKFECKTRSWPVIILFLHMLCI
jgi:hypothetical protein